MIDEIETFYKEIRENVLEMRRAVGLTEHLGGLEKSMSKRTIQQQSSFVDSCVDSNIESIER